VLTPNLFLESLVRMSLGLKKYEGKDRKYDAFSEEDGVQKYYEIKATASTGGKTTINLNVKPMFLFGFILFIVMIVYILVLKKYGRYFYKTKFFRR
jgi:hypothetical protein